VKTPLRYPGGKTRAVKHILPLIPEDCGELCSPFLGGGSVELAVAARGTKVHGYDLFEPLVCFWQSLLSEPIKLATLSDALRSEHPDFMLILKKGEGPQQVRGLIKENFTRLRDELRAELKTKFVYSPINAAKFYAINRSSFSGATFSGGWSKRASYARFTDSSIMRVKDFKEPNLTVGQAHFKDSINKHPDAFLYLDPPYLLSTGSNKLYGDRGNTHSGFDHRLLHEIITNRKNWVMSYNNCEEIREMYKDFEIIEAEWAYGMKNIGKKKMGSSSEILIKG